MMEIFVTAGLVGLFVVMSATVFNWVTKKLGDMDDTKRRRDDAKRVDDPETL